MNVVGGAALVFLSWAIALSVAASALPGPTAEGPNPPGSPPEPSNGCELHIWPALNMSSLGEGALLNHVQGQALRNPKVPLGPLLPPEEQINLISSANLPALTGHMSYRMVAHPHPAPHRRVSDPHVRRTASTATCYAEMSVDKVFYHYSPLMNSELRSLITFDQFGDGSVALFTFSSWGTAGLTAFPPKTPEGHDGAISDLNAAFVRTITAFAGHMRDAAAKSASQRSSR